MLRESLESKYSANSQRYFFKFLSSFSLFSDVLTIFKFIGLISASAVDKSAKKVFSFDNISFAAFKSIDLFLLTTIFFNSLLISSAPIFAVNPFKVWIIIYAVLLSELFIAVSNFSTSLQWLL